MDCMIVATSCDDQGYEDQTRWISEAGWTGVDSCPLIYFKRVGADIVALTRGSLWTFATAEQALLFKLTWGGQ